MNRSQWPVWVRVGLFSVRTRSTALSYMTVCLGGALLLLFSPKLSAVAFLAAAWYWFALRWVDRNAQWDPS
jgi:hypothetical protein